MARTLDERRTFRYPWELMTTDDETKKAAARAALAYLPDSGTVGLGTGSTTKHFIYGVAELVAQGRKLIGVPTSNQSRLLASSLGIPLSSDEGPWDIDVTVDGADEVSETLDLIKGGGGAHTREKIVNYASARNIIVVDESKLSRRLGEKWSVPVEIFEFAMHTTLQKLRSWGQTSLRKQDDATFKTDSGNLIVDLSCGPIDDPRALDMELRSLPGVVETGLFCGRADIVLVAGPAGVQVLKRSEELL